MSNHSVVHSTFNLERVYPLPPARVFAAWSEPVQKARWFAGEGREHELDFRVGGHEVTRARLDSGMRMSFESVYRDIEADLRIVYASTLSADDTLSTVSITTIEFIPTEEGTRLRLVEQATFLDGREEPSWREQGTNDWIDALGEALSRPAPA
jgi:uncharacterized protein YndB with AHSA1/START domain